MRIDIDLAATPMGDVRKLRAMLDIWTGDTPLPLFDRPLTGSFAPGPGPKVPQEDVDLAQLRTPSPVLDALPALKARSDSGELLAQEEAAGALSVLDDRGLPWDERIHSSNRERTAAGVWRKRRGVDDTTVEAVEAELRAGAPAIPPPPPMPMPVPADAPEGGWLPPGAPVPPPPPPSAPMTLASVMSRITAAMASGAVTFTQIAEAAQALGVATGLPGFQDRPDLLPAFLAAIGLADG